MNTEYKKLKKICDTIGYKPQDYWFNISLDYESFWFEKKISPSQFIWQRDPKEMIFTPIFIKKLYDYIFLHEEFAWQTDRSEMLENLEDVIGYTYTLVDKCKNK